MDPVREGVTYPKSWRTTAAVMPVPVTESRSGV